MYVSLQSVSESVHLSLGNTTCVQKLKGYFLRSKVDEIWHEDKYSDKVNVIALSTFLKGILMEIICKGQELSLNLLNCLFFFRVLKPQKPPLNFDIAQDTILFKMCACKLSFRSLGLRVWQYIICIGKHIHTIWGLVK